LVDWCLTDVTVNTMIRDADDDPTDGFHQIEVLDIADGASHTSETTVGTGTGAGTWDDNDTPDVAAHEAGHLLGLDDDYKYDDMGMWMAKDVAKNDCPPSIMAQTWPGNGKDPSGKSRHAEKVAEDAGIQCPIGCCLIDGPVGPDDQGLVAVLAFSEPVVKTGEQVSAQLAVDALADLTNVEVIMAFRRADFQLMNSNGPTGPGIPSFTTEVARVTFPPLVNLPHNLPPQTFEIELVALSLVSTEPITVQVQGRADSAETDAIGAIGQVTITSPGPETSRGPEIRN
ncbi:MAG: hypothetical protein HY335_02855, partial [Deinococcus sp.]|nr:hypothetical protein [Deinococcus sp.]